MPPLDARHALSPMVELELRDRLALTNSLSIQVS